MVCRYARSIHVRRKTASAFFVSFDSRQIAAAGAAADSADRHQGKSERVTVATGCLAGNLFAADLDPAGEWQTWRFVAPAVARVLAAKA